MEDGCGILGERRGLRGLVFAVIALGDGWEEELRCWMSWSLLVDVFLGIEFR